MKATRFAALPVSLTIVTSASLCIPLQGETQEAHAIIEEIVVTATRREQSLQEVPIAVSAMTAEDLTVRGVTALSDIEPGMMPGVSFATFTNNPSMLLAAIRGVSAMNGDSSRGTNELPVPVYLDGIYLGRAQGTGLEMIDPERIEVLRGPQGQLFGRNAEGGVIQYVSRKPSGELGIRASVSFGNYSDRRYRVSVDLPEMAGISVNIAGMSTEHDGYTDNTASPGQTYVPPEPTKDFSELDAHGYRIALRWQSQDGEFTIDYSYDDTDQAETQPFTTWVPVDTISPPVSEQPPSRDFPDNSFSLQNQPGFDGYARGHALILEKRLSDTITLKSLTAYRESGREGWGNLTEALPAGAVGLHFDAFEGVDADQTSQEFQFIGTWDRFDLTAGAIYYNEKVDDRRAGALTGPLAPVIFPTDPFEVDRTVQEAESDSYGVYAQGAYRPDAFDRKLELIVGLRYSDDKKDALRTYSLLLGGPVHLTSHYDEKRVDPAFTVRYQWTDNLNTYLRYATGYRAGGAAIRSSSFSSFKEQQTISWELGMKARWPDLGLQLNVALFHNTIEDEQINVREQPVLNPSLDAEINAPYDKKIKGAELELRWASTQFLDLGFNFAYLDPNRDLYDVVNPFAPPGVTITERFLTLNTPKHSGSLFADYVQPLPLGSLKFFASYSWSDDHYVTSSVGRTDFLLPTWDPEANKSSLVRARFGWVDIPVGAGELDVSLWGKNLTDDHHIVYAYSGCALNGGWCTYRRDPRTYGLEVKYRY